MKKIKVFISSPSDVDQERSIAMTVLNRLNRRYKEHLEIEGIFWKDKPLSAGDHFQGQIEDPSTADIVVVILWSRLGTNLSSEYKGKISSKQPVTGTEWEFEDAMSHYQTCGKPEVIVYKKSSDVLGVVGDKEEYERKTKEKNILDDFMKHWFVDEDGAFKAAFHQFEQLQEFENRLETHLENLMQTYLKKMIGESTRWFKGSPFRGLNSFELEHQEIFFGRREQIYQIRTTFLNLVKQQHPFLLVIGASGCGKSSLLKAGVLPYLLQSDVAQNVAVIRHCIFKPNDNPADLLHSLSTALFKTFEKELRALSYSPQKLKEALISDITPIKRAINKIRDEQKLIKEATVKIVIIIDQFEEIFTNKAFLKEQKEQFINIINTFVKSGHFWVLASMRSDFIKHTDDLSQLKELLSHKESRYLLSFPSVSQTRELIIKPAREAGVRYERKDGKDLDEVLLENATKNVTSLPLLEYVLEELYIARDKKNLLTFEAYEKMGEIEGAVGQKAEAVYNNLSSSGKKAFESLIRMLVTISQEDSRQKSAKTIPYNSIKESKEKVNIIEIMSSKEVRLFVKDRDSFGQIAIRVAHEALFNNWDRAVKIILASGHDIIVRERLEKLSYDWKNADKKDKKSLLLNDGLPINEALDLIDRRGDELSKDILSFIESSQDRVKYKRWQKRGLIAAGVVALFAIYNSGQTAKAEEEKAKIAKIETQKLADFMLNDLRDKLEPIGRLDILQDTQDKVGKYLKQTDEQNSSKQRNIDIEKVKEKLLSSFQESSENLNSQNLLQNIRSIENMQHMNHKMMREPLVDEKEDDETRLGILAGMQIEINRYLKSTDDEDLNQNLTPLSLRAKLHSNQGEIYEIEGKLEEAIKEYSSAVEIYKELIELDPNNPEWEQNLAHVYDKIGIIYYRKLSDLSAASEFFQEALKIREKLIKLDPDSTDLQFDISTSYQYIGLVHDNQGKYKEAEKLFKDSLEIRKRLVRLEPENNKWQRALASIYNEIGYIYRQQDKFEEAVLEFKKELNIREALTLIEPNNNLWKYELSKNHRDLGYTYLLQGLILEFQAKILEIKEKHQEAEPKHQEAQSKYELSENEHKKALKINEELVNFEPKNTDWLLGLSLGYLALGNTYSLQGNLKESIKQYQLAEDVYDKLLKIDPDNTLWKLASAKNYEMIGSIYELEGKFIEALIVYANAQEIRRELVAFDSENISFLEDLALNYEQISRVHSSLGNLNEELDALNKEQEIKKKLVKLNPDNIIWQKSLANNYNRVSSVYVELKEPLKQIEQQQKSLEIMKKLIVIDPKDDAIQSHMSANLRQIYGIYYNLDEPAGVEDTLTVYKWLIELAPSSKHFQSGMAYNYLNLFLVEFYPEKITTDKAIGYLQDAVSFLQKLKDDGYLHEDNFELLETFKGWI